MKAKRDARLERLFHRAITATVALGGIILSLAEGNWFPSAVTPVVAVVAWLLVDRHRRFHVSLAVANVLGAIAFICAASEFRSNNIEGKLLSGAHLIVYLTWVVLLMQKDVRQIWWLLALSVLQIAVASVLTNSPLFGVSLVAVMAVMIWTLAVFSLFRAYRRFHAGATADATFEAPARRVDDASPIMIRNGLQLDPGEPWVNKQLRGVVAVAVLGSLVMSLIVFALFPRIWVPGSPFADMARDEGRRLQGRTGFTETVTLGDIGQVLQSDNRAFQFQIRDIRLEENVSVEEFLSQMQMDEIRFRGNALEQYEDAKWRHQIPEKLEDKFGRLIGPSARYEVQVIQDPPIGEVVFAVQPLTRADSSVKNDRILRWQVSGVLNWESSQSRRRSDPDVQRAYTISCPSVKEFPDATFENWSFPPGESPEDVEVRRGKHRRILQRWFITENLDSELPELFRIANELCTDDGEIVEPRACAQRIMNYLSLKNGFQYSLTIPFNNEALDPIEDFLVNTRSGSCEYFASACALMLQAVGVPARIVNGYVGCELNNVSGRYEVRQKHAHSWVETYFENRWHTLDPTPSSPRQDLVAASRSMVFFRQLKLAMSDIWSSGVQNLSWEQQLALVAPALRTLRAMWDDIRQRGIWTSVRGFVTELMTSPEKWFSWQGGVVTFLLLLVAALLWRLHLFRRLLSWLDRFRDRFGVRERTTRSVIRFYERFRGLCEANGLVMASSSTAFETAEAATQFFSERLPTSELRSAPGLIAAAFNDVRFGNLELSTTRAESVREALSEFSEAVSRKPSMDELPQNSVTGD
jgi:transglutaminase-like putative cysteine protease